MLCIGRDQPAQQRERLEVTELALLQRVSQAAGGREQGQQRDLCFTGAAARVCHARPELEMVPVVPELLA
jgi:hypothetical protein